MMKKEHLKAVLLLSGAILLLAATSEVFAQGSFAAPICAKKYSFYPQGGNFFGDLFPNNFVDLDNSPGILDWHCGNATYDGHLGIDTEILDFSSQAVGVPIFAVLDGTVLEAHDGEPDMNTTGPNVPPNYVKLDHGDGLTTAYLHMKRNSVAVSVGQLVKAGQQIGLTGSSGMSTRPHLHFQSELNGVVFEPYAGSCRGGVSSWIAQPSYRTDLYLRELVLTGDNLANWQGYPFDTSRTGTFLTGTRSVGFWCALGNGDSLRTISLRYLRPDNSVALAPTPFTTNSFFRNGVIDFFYIFNLDVTGLWHLEISINNHVVASAPFTVIGSGSPVNRAPGGVQAAFDPPAPTADDVLFCRITSSTLFLDPDYDLPRFHYLWKVNGATVRDVISAGLADAIPRNTAMAGDTVTCTITPSDGTLDGPSTVVSSPVAAPASVSDHLLNISTRLPVRTGDDVLIGGMIATGSDMKRVIIRAIGPSLGAFGVQGFLPDPVLELHDSSGATIASNDDWRASSQAAEIQATGIAPSNDLEAAIIANLNPNQSYTAIVRGKGTATGIAVVEAYDLAPNANSKLANISTRGFVDTGDNVMIGGFIIGGAGQGSARIVVRAIGPSLAGFGIANPLANPVLEIHDGNGVLETSNDDWRDCQAAEIQATGLQPTNDRESAVLATLRPGNYTAIVRGKDSTTGVALIEAYNIQ
jgi:hypothetical protein